MKKQSSSNNPHNERSRRDKQAHSHAASSLPFSKPTSLPFVSDVHCSSIPSLQPSVCIAERLLFHTSAFSLATSHLHADLSFENALDLELSAIASEKIVKLAHNGPRPSNHRSFRLLVAYPTHTHPAADLPLTPLSTRTGKASLYKSAAEL